MASRSYDCPMCGYYGPLEQGDCPMCGYTVVEYGTKRKVVRKTVTPGPTRRIPPPPPEKPQSRRRKSSPPRKKKNTGGDGGSGIGKLIAVIIIFLLLIYFWPHWYPMVRNALEQGTSNAPVNYRNYPSEAEFTLKRVETISISGGEAHYNFHTPFAGDIPDSGSIQNILDSSVSPLPSSGSYSSWRFMEWDEHTSRNVNIEISYHARVSTVTWDVGEEDSGTVDMIPQNIKDKYVRNQWAEVTRDTDGDGMEDAPSDNDGDGIPDSHKIEIDNPQIVSLADQIVGDETNVYAMLEDIYVYMTQTGGFDYLTGRTGLPAKCTVTLDRKNGDCDDQSILFASLARSKGIPAWLVLGWLYDPQTGKWGGHAWLNAYIPLANGDHVIGTIDVVNRQFMFRDPYRLTEWTDDGQEGHWDGSEWVAGTLDYYYYSFTYSYTGHVSVDHEGEIVNLGYEPRGEERYVDVGDTVGEKGGDVKTKLPGFKFPMVLVSVVSSILLMSAWHGKRRRIVR